MSANNVASEDLSMQTKEVEKVKHDKNTFDEVVSQFTKALQPPIRVISEDIPNKIPNGTQDISKDQREKSEVSLIVSSASDEVVLCSVKNEQDIPPTQVILPQHDKKFNQDSEVTDCEFAEINTNKSPQSELLQNEMAQQVIIPEDYKTEKQSSEDISANNLASKDLSIQIKEKVGPNNIKHDKNTFNEVVSNLRTKLQNLIKVLCEDIPNEPNDIDKFQRDNDSLGGSSNEDDEVVPCAVDDNVKNEQDENENSNSDIDLPIQKDNDVLIGNNAPLANVSESSDEESTPKKSKRFTFTDSDLPDDDEVKMYLKPYPEPVVAESSSESEVESSSEDESNEFLRRCRKTEPVANIDLTRMTGIEKLPSRVMTRLRNSDRMFKPIYLKEQEAQMNGDIIIENINRLKSFKKTKTHKDSKNHESIKEVKNGNTPRKKTDNKRNAHKRKVKVNIGNVERKRKKSKTKSLSRKNTKEDSLELSSRSAAKTTTRTTRSMKKENDGKNTRSKCIIPGNKNKKPVRKRIPYNKERTISPDNERRRSKRQQKATEKDDDKMKPPISTLKKSIHEQSTVYNISSSSSESPKSLKRSLVDDSDVPSPKRTRSYYNNNNNDGINKASQRATPARAGKTPHVHLSPFHVKQHRQDKQDPYVQLVRYEPPQKSKRTLNSNRKVLTRSQLAGRRFHRACKQTREAAKTSTKRL